MGGEGGVWEEREVGGMGGVGGCGKRDEGRYIDVCWMRAGQCSERC